MRESTFPMRGHKQADRSVAWCVDRLGLAPRQLVRAAMVIGAADLWGLSAASTRVIVCIGREDEDAVDWPQGTYVLSISPDDARDALGLDAPPAASI